MLCHALDSGSEWGQSPVIETVTQEPGLAEECREPGRRVCPGARQELVVMRLVVVLSVGVAEFCELDMASAGTSSCGVVVRPDDDACPGGGLKPCFQRDCRRR